jgi:DNA-directed RNA polymerase subunit M/transcription elongation factor TFIIS
MPKLLEGKEILDILQKYECGEIVNKILTGMIVESKQESGRLRQLFEITDRRKYALIRMPSVYLDAALDFRWIRAGRISHHGENPMDKLSMGFIAAEQLSKEEFLQRLDNQAMDQILTEAQKIINEAKQPCPKCGSTDVGFKKKIEHGHGDSTFEAWIECNVCEHRGKVVSNWGSTPEDKDIRSAWENWNGNV